MASSSIEWTEQTWNPTTGCSKISQGCKLYYAEIMTRRLKAMGKAKYQAGFNKVVTHASELAVPLRRKKPTIWFVDSMSDLFHKDVPIELIEQVFAVMNQTDWHTYQILTNRSERMWSISHFLN
jgi:protein gp37